MSDVVGLSCAMGAVVLFGSNFLPLKRYEVGDGFFFQWAMCAGIWVVGVGVALLHPYSPAPPPFEPLAALGGAVWCTGQLSVPMIVKSIGMAKGLIIWGSTAMVSALVSNPRAQLRTTQVRAFVPRQIAGWACGVFGLLGVRSQAAEVHSWPLNVAGLLLSLASLCVSLLLQPETQPAGRMNGNGHAHVHAAGLTEQLLDNSAATDAVGRTPSSSLGTGIALCAGVFFGVNFNGGKARRLIRSCTRGDTLPTTSTPHAQSSSTARRLTYGCSNPGVTAQYVIDRAGTPAYPNASAHGLDYAPSQFSGIFLASTCYFAIYAGCTGNRPDVRPEIALPALASGAMWGVADALWFVANEQLGFVVAFPIVLAGPGIVASLWGIFVLGELRGCANMMLTALVAVLVTGGAVLISLSRMG